MTTIDVNVIVTLVLVFAMCIVAIATSIGPMFLSYLERKRKEQAEDDARRNREKDLCVLLGNLVKVDATFDYVGSRGGNREIDYKEVLNLLQPPAKSGGKGE
ncbi:hypothetical protein Mpet_2307 [Methanolacinia petrolearia DSM 11571]|uniref:Uncharacterized protein n=1 Tax=Methanolacinia petrolearia (strain DSM 11571 / OCM 486 / SEBR 4847) TaxID=679926 RepID=E1RD71_METP4|nr:hypothetical protein [Methanolacinia petrolearia]ADN37054.1 hypothetical protein Mpet_2307 [Methanolacinia petrolearia DSM 11571]